jgi:hypothetical protein
MLNTKSNNFVLTKEQLGKEKNVVKERFVPRPGYNITLANGITYKVVFTNVGQLRFTAVFVGVLSSPFVGIKPMKEVTTA